jgi:hypothetical protein
MDDKKIDEYELKLIEKEKILKNCQKKKSLKSCLECDKIISCAIRNEYVKAVYNSMNKGQSGGFEF